MPKGGAANIQSPKDDVIQSVERFLKKGEAAGSHPAKLLVLANFLEEVFGVKVEELLPGIEAKVGSKILGAKGSIDLLYSAVVIELKTHYDRERQDAVVGLKKYFQSLLEAFPNRHYIGLATDLGQFELFAPTIDEGKVVDVKSVDRLDSRTRPPEEILLWLDAVIISGQARVPTADELSRKFGPGSATFVIATADLVALWRKVRGRKKNQLKLRIWTRIMEIVYGTAPNEDAFVSQTYLSLLARLLVYLKLERAPLTGVSDVRSILSGQFFIERGITNLIEEDFFAWVLDDSIEEETGEVALGLSRALQIYDMERADEDLFKEGATIVPHNFWFVDFVLSGHLGIDRSKPLLKTSTEANRVAKRTWKGTEFEGRVESRFLHAVFLGKDLVPFGTLPPRPVALPLVSRRGKLELWDVDRLLAEGYPLMAKWLQKAEKTWKERRSEKSAKSYPSILDRLDYQSTLSGQDPLKRFIVIYNARGADAMCTVLDREQLPVWSLGDVTIKPSGVVADSTNFYYETGDELEAHYQCAVLNAPCISAAVKPFQPRGAYGHRDIGRRPLMLQVQKFDPTNGSHIRLAELSKSALRVVGALPSKGKGFRTLRREASVAVKSIVDEIDSIVESLGMADTSEELPPRS